MATINTGTGTSGGGDDDTTTDSDEETKVADVADDARDDATPTGGIDDGEPVSGVDGAGSPRDDSEPTPVEGPPERVEETAEAAADRQRDVAASAPPTNDQLIARARDSRSAGLPNPLSEYDPDELRVDRSGEEPVVRPRQEAVRERARQRAAAENPFRGPEDFVATTEGGEVRTRRRQAPLFEDVRESLGGDPPEESAIFRATQQASRGVQRTAGFLAGLQKRQNTVPDTRVDVGEGRDVNLGAADRGATVGAASAVNFFGAALDARRLGSRTFELAEANIEDRAAAARDIRAGQGDVEDVAALAGFPTGPEQQAELRKNRRSVENTIDDVKLAYDRSPSRVVGAGAGAVAGAALASGASGFAAPRALRGARASVRTVGSRDADLGDVTTDATARFYDSDIDAEPPEGQFPSAENPSLYRDAPAEAVRRQSTTNRPDAIAERFEEAGVEAGEETADLMKALDREPEGPGQGRGGFRAPEPEDRATTYEVEEGAFFSPDLSPYFLGATESPDVSLRPGIPRLGDQPTAIVARTRVREPEADDLRGLDRELADADEPVARTKPASETNPAEIEAVVPAGTDLVDVGGRGLLESAARRLGIGSDFAVDVGDRTVPLRPVTDPDLRQSGRGGGGLLSDERGQVGAGGGRGLFGPRRVRIDASRREFDAGVDRPTPVVPSAGGGTSRAAEATARVDTGAQRRSRRTTGTDRRSGRRGRDDRREMPFSGSSSGGSSGGRGGVPSGGSVGDSTGEAGTSFGRGSGGSGGGSGGSVGGGGGLAFGIIGSSGAGDGGASTPRRFDLDADRSKKDVQRRYLAGDRQFERDLADPEDVVDTGSVDDIEFF